MADASCPVPEEYRGVHGVFNVYNQKIDPRNNMPVAASQSMAPGQRRKISTERQRSTIPKSGVSSAEASTWTYPSPQMFYNSLVRKGKATDCTEDDMESVVSVHNAMNEDTWRRVVAWERLHVHECRDPMLLRFLGRPDDLSPLAWARYLTGGGKPFDRHDWYVDRCGQQVRYVIDYYFHEDKAGTPGQFDLVVRPAADSVGAGGGSSEDGDIRRVRDVGGAVSHLGEQRRDREGGVRGEHDRAGAVARVGGEGGRRRRQVAPIRT